MMRVLRAGVVVMVTGSQRQVDRVSRSTQPAAATGAVLQRAPAE